MIEHMKSNFTLLITGANGFVGKSIIDYISNFPHELKPKTIILASRTGIDPEMRKQLDGVEIMECKNDLREPWNFKFKPTHILNFAADGSGNAYAPDAAAGFERIVDNLIHWCEQLDNPKVFHSSSGACFGYFPIHLENNTQPNRDVLQRKRIFVDSRLRAEEKLHHADSRGEIDLRMGRLFTFSGRHLVTKLQYALPSFMDQAIKN